MTELNNYPSIKKELASHILDRINDGVIDDKNKDEWRFYCFNEDYHIVYYSEAIKWLKNNNIDYLNTKKEMSRINEFLLNIDSLNYPYLTDTLVDLETLSDHLFIVLSHYDYKRLNSVKPKSKPFKCEKLAVYKNPKGRIICYIVKYNDSNFMVKTGKPSDSTCLSWNYNSFKDAEITADKYFNDYIKKL